MTFATRFLTILVVLTIGTGIGYTAYENGWVGGPSGMTGNSMASAGVSPEWLNNIETAAGQAETDNTQVLVTVNGEAITEEDFQEAVSNLPSALRNVPADQIKDMVIEQMVNAELLEQQAMAQNLGNDPEVIDQLTELRGQIMRNIYIERAIAERMTDEKLMEAYNAYVEGLGEQMEVKARHILVETQEAAQALIAQLNEGADFATLASENSTGPSAATGGDLGYFVKEDMVPPFAEAAFALNAGEMTQQPVETNFGWHVIMVEDKRVREAPAFADVRDMLEQQMEGQIFRELVQDLREGASIEMMVEPAAGEMTEQTGEAAQEQMQAVEEPVSAVEGESSTETEMDQ